MCSENRQETIFSAEKNEKRNKLVNQIAFDLTTKIKKKKTFYECSLFSTPLISIKCQWNTSNSTNEHAIVLWTFE